MNRLRSVSIAGGLKIGKIDILKKNQEGKSGASIVLSKHD
jgi:hypothetical protein